MSEAYIVSAMTLSLHMCVDVYKSTLKLITSVNIIFVTFVLIILLNFRVVY